MSLSSDKEIVEVELPLRQRAHFFAIDLAARDAED
jgi:hypothetical protein